MNCGQQYDFIIHFQYSDYDISHLTMYNFCYCCTVHFDNIKILFTNKCILLLNT